MPSIKQSIKKSKEKDKLVVEPDFKSKHNLLFEVALHFEPDFMNFRVGTCTGLYSWNDKQYIIVAVVNDQPSNGHLDDVFEWFENSCRRDKKDLVVAELMNERFAKHLITKRGFAILNKTDLIKKIK
jgi:hypothetical protein